MDNRISEWDYKPLWERHAAEMAIGRSEDYSDFIQRHYEVLKNSFDEECFLHYQGLFYPYRDKRMFLSTLYWHWVREYAKFNEFGRQVLEGRYGAEINVHHTNYAVCGQEHLYLDTLQVLGREQHDLHHRRSRYADYGIPPLLLRSSSPGSFACSWQQRYHPRQRIRARWMFNELDTASEDEPYNNRVWLICNNCYEAATREATFKFVSTLSAPKLVNWKESESDTFVDLDACDAWIFIHIIKRCEFEGTTGGFYFYGGLEYMLKQ